MLTVHQAEECIARHLHRPVKEVIEFDQALHRVLAEPIVADHPLPPFNRVMMDGVALRSEDLRNGIRIFSVVGIQKAGQIPLTLEHSGTAIEIMTGAVMCEGADVVVPYEQIEFQEGKVTVLRADYAPWTNIHLRGSDRKKDEILVNRGSILRAADLGIAASTGQTHLAVNSLPKTAIVSTGDELVEPGEQPQPHQIRRSNVFVIEALLHQHGINAGLFHVPDQGDSLQQVLTSLLENYDLIVLSGGVSKGKFDLIPSVLESLGVTIHLHRIAQKPGKPMLFGTKNTTAVFGLPGNPVSTVMCTARYVLPWLRKSTGLEEPALFGKLSLPYTPKGDLTFFLPARTHVNESGELLADPLPGNGSGDFSNLHGADVFVEMGAGNHGPLYRFWKI